MYDGRPIKRYDSWFDGNLVTRAGEGILERYDNWAIKELRRLKLVWSSWTDGAAGPDDLVKLGPLNGAELGFRKLRTDNPGMLRLFFLSLLWRAGATGIPGYKVDVSPERLGILRQMLLSGNPKPLDVFPITLTQLTTKGSWHAAGPQVQHKIIPGTDNSPETSLRFYRFYLEGLVIHIDDETTDPIIGRWTNMSVGSSEQLMVLARPFEGSRQEMWINTLIGQTERDYPEAVARIFSEKY